MQNRKIESDFVQWEKLEVDRVQAEAKPATPASLARDAAFVYQEFGFPFTVSNGKGIIYQAPSLIQKNQPPQHTQHSSPTEERRLQKLQERREQSSQARIGRNERRNQNHAAFTGTIGGGYYEKGIRHVNPRASKLKSR